MHFFSTQFSFRQPAPLTKSCRWGIPSRGANPTDILPQASAGPNQSVNEFDTVRLDASASMDSKNGTLSYQWVQTAGTAVVLSDDQATRPIFVAPDAGSSGKILRFRVTVPWTVATAVSMIPARSSRASVAAVSLMSTPMVTTPLTAWMGMLITTVFLI
jgi:hypothetical protein